MLYTRVSQPHHHWQSGLDNSLLLGSVLCNVKYLAAPLAPYTLHARASPTPNCDNQNYFQTLPNVPHPPRNIIASDWEPLVSTKEVDKNKNS